MSDFISVAKGIVAGTVIAMAMGAAFMIVMKFTFAFGSLIGVLP